jgi:hypothetical protein
MAHVRTQERLVITDTENKGQCDLSGGRIWMVILVVPLLCSFGERKGTRAIQVAGNGKRVHFGPDVMS